MIIISQNNRSFNYTKIKLFDWHTMVKLWKKFKLNDKFKGKMLHETQYPFYIKIYI